MGVWFSMGSGGASGAWGAVLASVLLGCVSVPELSAKQSFPTSDDEIDPRGDFALNVQVTRFVEERALRKPELSKSVDVQIGAMFRYMREHGHGDVKLAPWRHYREGDRRAEIGRLLYTALELVPHLDLERGPSELSKVSLQALADLLGDDGRLSATGATNPADEAQLAIAQRDGIAFLGVRALTEAMGDRIAAVLSQWAASERPPRALIVDLSRCTHAMPATAAQLVNEFAPGKLAFELELGLTPHSEPMKESYASEAAWGAGAYGSMPVFVVVSEQTTSMGEAVALALRHHHGARILGTPTRGTGRVMAELTLPDHTRFEVTVADLNGADGSSLHGVQVIPDACPGAQALHALEPRTLESARQSCVSRATTQAEAVDFVVGLLAVQNAAPVAVAPAQATAP